MNPASLKSQPNRQLYVQTLRGMSEAERLEKALELTQTARDLMRYGLAERFPDATEAELHAMFLERLERCRRRTY